MRTPLDERPCRTYTEALGDRLKLQRENAELRGRMEASLRTQLEHGGNGASPIDAKLRDVKNTLE